VWGDEPITNTGESRPLADHAQLADGIAVRHGGGVLGAVDLQRQLTQDEGQQHTDEPYPG